MKKELYLLEALTITNYFDNLSKEKRDALPLKVYYALKKVVKKLSDDVNQFKEVRDEEIKKIRDDFFSEEKSEETMIPKVDDKGNPVLDENGNQVAESGRKIKSEFIEDYSAAMRNLEEKLNEIASEKNTYEYNSVDIGEMVAELPNNTPLDAEDLDVLDEIFTENVR